MILRKIASKAALIRERSRIYDVLIEVLGRGPRGGRLDQLTAKLLNEPNFETAVAMVSNSDEELLSKIITESCDMLGITADEYIKKAVSKGINDIEEYNKEHQKKPFDIYEQCSKYRIGCFILLAHIDYQFNPDNQTGYTHPKSDSRNNGFDLIDSGIYNGTVKFSDYFFFKTVEVNVEQCSQVSRNWIGNRYNNSECKNIARLTYSVVEGLSKIFSDHDICQNIDFEMEHQLKEIHEYFGLIDESWENSYEQEMYWLEKASHIITENISKNELSYVSNRKLNDSKLTLEIAKAKRQSNTLNHLVINIELYMPNMSKFTIDGYLKNDPSITFSDKNPPSIIGDKTSEFYFIYELISKCLDDLKSKM